MKKLYILFAYVLFFLSFPFIASAHEVYVLTQSQMEYGRSHVGPNVWLALTNPHNFLVFCSISIGVGIAFLLLIFFMRTSLAESIRQHIYRFREWGAIILRVILAICFFSSAYTNSFLGPELSLSDLPHTILLKTILYIISGLLLIGLFTELAAFIGVIVFVFATWYFDLYILTYFYYFPELLILMVVGSRRLSMDQLMFGQKVITSKMSLFIQKYEPALLRISFGFALLYTAVTVKLLHPLIPYMVVTQYHLTQFHWLFPQDPSLVTLGAILAEITIALAIMVGFEMRFVIFVTLFYITLSLLFFRETVWPHLMLYGISLYILLNREKFALDNVLIYWKNKKIHK